MTYTLLLLYPNEAHTTFDMTYYLEKHMPKVERIWRKHGLRSWHVTKYNSTLDGPKPTYLLGTTIEWGSEDDMKATLKDPEVAELFEDFENFGNTPPISVARSALQIELLDSN
ncbi:hypothetical protein CFAM422_012403 [Trichoderma lentiforme]|uniref:EthD domain-containing protein n=1 Tax=Trichoderma lentiforme TaxID=1567552 RepID=A0A9P4X560_9HYPO|nr:hypothetical protein CFAM422_012403 [Trichoderma lentiforme]